MEIHKRNKQVITEYPTLIVSMTTWPARINTTAIKALTNLIYIKNSIIYKDYIQIKLVLSTCDFPNVESLPKAYQDLYNNKDIDIIFDKGTLKAHNKIVPTAELYGDKHILVVDDDKLYSCDFLGTFYKDILKFPEDVIVGRTSHKLIPKDGKIISVKFPDIFHLEPYKIIKNEKFASGISGTVFPPHTFTDKRFFDRELIKKLCEQSDEDWCWLFCVLGKKRMRVSSHYMRVQKDLHGE